MSNIRSNLLHPGWRLFWWCAHISREIAGRASRLPFRSTIALSSVGHTPSGSEDNQYFRVFGYRPWQICMPSAISLYLKTALHVDCCEQIVQVKRINKINLASRNAPTQPMASQLHEWDLSNFGPIALVPSFPARLSKHCSTLPLPSLLQP